MKNLGLQDEAQRPGAGHPAGAPPTATFGNGTNLETDPLIRIGLKRMSFDFYMWSLDRFIRFMTCTVDVDVPLNLTVTPDGLMPVVDKIGVNNGERTNSSLLTEEPRDIAA